ncbi:HD domain-containing phosphohydrolase [Desulfothermus sp.]
MADSIISKATNLLIARRPKEKLDGFFEFLEKNFGIDGACVYIWTPEYNMFRSCNLEWVKEDFKESLEMIITSLYKGHDIWFLPLGKNSYADEVLKTGKPLYVRDTSKSPYWGDRIRYKGGIRSTYTYLLINREDFKVIIIFFSRHKDGFSKDFILFIEGIVDKLSPIIEVIIHEEMQEIDKIHLKKELEQRNHQLEILLNMSRQLSFASTYEEALKIVRNLLPFGVKYDFFSMLIVSEYIKKIFIYPSYYLSDNLINYIVKNMFKELSKYMKIDDNEFEIYVEKPMYDNFQCIREVDELFLSPITLSPEERELGIFCIGRKGKEFNKEEKRFLNLVFTQLTITFIRIIELKEREKSIVQNMLYNFPEAVILIDNNLKILLYNKIGEELISEFGYISNKDQLLKFKDISIKKLIKSDKRELDVVIGKDKEGRILKLTVQPIDIPYPSPTWLVMVSDVTERRNFQQKMHKMLEGTVYSLALAIERRDPYTAGHQKNVANLTVKIAKKLGLDEEKINILFMGALLHDLGKIAIPSEILTRPGKLTPEEFALIKTHPRVGYEILKDVEFVGPVKEMVLYHHERLDGSGYPAGLKGDLIPMEARLLAVADVVDAISSHRPYRPALGLEMALEEIKKNRGILYDPDVVDACLSIDFSK